MQQQPKKENTLTSRNFKYGSIATGMTVLFLASVIILNLIVSSIAARHTLNWDLTTNKNFELTKDTKEFLGSLSKDINIDLLSTEEDFTRLDPNTREANQVLKQYQRCSGHVKLNYIDVVKNPAYTANYKKENLRPNSIVVKCDEEYQILTAYDLFDIKQSYNGQSEIVASKAEQALTSAILNVTMEDKTKVSFIEGYDEEDPQGLTNLLEKNSYEIIETNITTEDIAQDSDIVVIFGPQRDYMPEAIEKLENFIKNGGKYGKNLIFIAAPQVKGLPNLFGFLEKYGIKAQEGLIFETDQAHRIPRGSIASFLADYEGGTYDSGLKSQKVPVLVDGCLPLSSTDPKKAEVMLKSSPKSGIIPLDAANDWKPTEDKFTGPIAAAVSAKTGPETSEAGGKDSNILAFGSVNIFNPQFLTSTALNNSEYTLNVFHLLSGEKDVKHINIEPKAVNNAELNITEGQQNTIGPIIYLLLPLLIATVGIFVFYKRRNK